MIPNPTNATRMRTSPWFERTAQKRHVFGLDMTSTIKVKQSPENDGAILHRTLKRAGRHDPMQCENSFTSTPPQLSGIVPAWISPSLATVHRSPATHRISAHKDLSDELVTTRLFLWT